MTRTVDLVRSHRERYVFAAVCSLLALGFAAWFPPSPARFDMVLWALYFPCLAARLSEFLPSDYALRDLAFRTRAPVSTAVILVFGIAMIVATAFDLPPNSLNEHLSSHPPVNAAPLMTAAALLQVVLLLVLHARSESETRSLLRRVMAASPKFDAPAPGEWIRMTGTVESPSPVQVKNQLAVFALVTETEESEGPTSSPNIEVKRNRLGGDFVVRVGAIEVAINPNDLRCSGLLNLTRDQKISGKDLSESLDYLPVGVNVLVAGRFQSQSSSEARDVRVSLSASPDAPALVLRTDDSETLFAMYRTAFRLRGVSLAVMAVMGLLMAGAAALVLPSLPAFQLPLPS